ncbi:MAG: sigma-70 family RNA polymerase sigma factor [Planctomycetaceae bacterium]|nr:sigma-70 family RNA polymerase sigma factor [Planctomycetaceae bacterium]
MLAQKVAAGQPGAYEEMVCRYCRPLMEFAAGRMHCWHDGQDIVQETFLRAYLHAGSFNSQHSLRQWLFTIAYRLMVSSWRKKRPVRLSEEAADLLQARATAPDEDESDLWKAARRIGPEAHTALWLRYKQDMSIDEIAKVMQKTTIAVRVLLHRARKRLGAMLESNTAAGVCPPAEPVPYSERTV